MNLDKNSVKNISQNLDYNSDDINRIITSVLQDSPITDEVYFITDLQEIARNNFNVIVNRMGNRIPPDSYKKDLVVYAASESVYNKLIINSNYEVYPTNDYFGNEIFPTLESSLSRSHLAGFDIVKKEDIDLKSLHTRYDNASFVSYDLFMKKTSNRDVISYRELMSTLLPIAQNFFIYPICKRFTEKKVVKNGIFTSKMNYKNIKFDDILGYVAVLPYIFDKSNMDLFYIFCKYLNLMTLKPVFKSVVKYVQNADMRSLLKDCFSNGMLSSYFNLLTYNPYYANLVEYNDDRYIVFYRR